MQHQSQVSKNSSGALLAGPRFEGARAEKRPLRQVYQAASASGCHLSLKSSKEGRRPINGDVSIPGRLIIHQLGVLGVSVPRAFLRYHMQ